MTGFLRGSATALITPFTEDSVNFEVLGTLIDHQIENGTDALVVLGTTGEPTTMTEKEKDAVITFAKERIAGRALLIVGTGANSTEKAVKATVRATELGADGVLAVTPYYNKCTQKGLIAYYEAICSATPLPVIAYNVPGRTGVNILPETMEKIAELPNMAGIKEASGNMAQVVETARLIRGKCDLYSGEDVLNLPILSVGGTAVISVLAGIVPHEVKELTRAALGYRLYTANKLADRLLPLAKACFAEVNPIPVKAALNLLGFEAGTPRAPLTDAEPQTYELLRSALIELGLKVTS